MIDENYFGLYKKDEAVIETQHFQYHVMVSLLSAPIFQYIKKSIQALINFCFKGGEKHYDVVMKFDSTRTHDKNEVNAIFDMVFLILVIQFQRGNVFLVFVICHVHKSLESQFFQTQHVLWLIYLFITKTINGY